MTQDVARLSMSCAPKAVRALVPSGAEARPARRLLELRDAALEQQSAREATQACSAALVQQLTELRGLVEERLAAVATLATELGLAVAREIVAVAIDRQTIDPLPAVRRCLQACVTSGERAGMTVYVSAADHQRLRSLAELQNVHLAVAPELTAGSVRVHTEAGSVVYDPLEVLQRVSDELRRELSACP